MSYIKNASYFLKLQLSSVVLLLCSGLCWGQPTRHIKSFNLGVGIEKPMSFIYDFVDDNDFRTSFYKDSEIIPLGLSLNLSKNVGRKTHLHFSLLGRALGNTAYTYHQDKSIDEINYTFTDSNFVRSNLFQLQLGAKYFLNNAPLGTYLHANLNVAYINNEIFRKSTLGSEFILHTETFAPAKHQSILYGIDLGMGATKMISNRLLLDYGFHISPFWFLLSPNNMDAHWINHTINAEGFIPGYSKGNVELLNKKLLATEFLKFYLKIGLQNFKYE
ncbi:hypothetical protein [Lishizhenia tianjinensis]|nr:hypothetical protein [Lishizhenia tianjinensis]